MIDQISKKLEHCSPKPQEDYIRLELEMSELKKENKVLATEVESLKFQRKSPGMFALKLK